MTATLRDLRARARRSLQAAHYDYYAGGAGDETALGENERAFRRLALLPRVLRGAEHRDTAVTLCGDRSAAPLVVSPTAFHRLAHPDGERAVARAAAATGTILTTGMAATTAVAEVVEAARAERADAAVWFQLYLQPEPEVTEALVRRAEKAGCSALVVTVDSPVFGRRERDDRHGFHDLPDGLAAENMRDLPGTEPGGLRPIAMSPALSWHELRRLRAQTSLPVLLKGVLHPEDARIAVAEGVDGLIVSNHGGRQLDAAPATVEVLPRIVDAVAGACQARPGQRGSVPVLLDGGVRRGSDIAVALALGATAVGVGRPVLWGLAADGEAGVRQVLRLLADEFDHTLALCGGRSPADLTRDMVVPRGAPARPVGTGGPPW